MSMHQRTKNGGRGGNPSTPSLSFSGAKNGNFFLKHFLAAEEAATVLMAPKWQVGEGRKVTKRKRGRSEKVSLCFCRRGKKSFSSFFQETGKSSGLSSSS